MMAKKRSNAIDGGNSAVAGDHVMSNESKEAAYRQKIANERKYSKTETMPTQTNRDTQKTMKIVFGIQK